MTKPLSSTAQAVIYAFSADNYGVYLEGDPDRMAAAIRALVEKTLPEEDCPHTGPANQIAWSVRYGLRVAHLAVADELEGK